MSFQKGFTFSEKGEFRKQLRSTPKKFPTQDLMEDGKINDGLYSELLSMKEENEAYLNDYVIKVDNIESKLENVNFKLELLTRQTTTAEEFERRLYKLELAMEQFSDLQGNYHQLKLKVNELSNAVAILKEQKNHNYNILESMLRDQITNSFGELKLSFDNNINRLNQMFTDNFEQNAAIIKYLECPTVDALKSTEKPTSTVDKDINKLQSNLQSNIEHVENTKEHSTQFNTQDDKNDKKVTVQKSKDDHLKQENGKAAPIVFGDSKTSFFNLNTSKNSCSIKPVETVIFNEKNITNEATENQIGNTFIFGTPNDSQSVSVTKTSETNIFNQKDVLKNSSTINTDGKSLFNLGAFKESPPLVSLSQPINTDSSLFNKNSSKPAGIFSNLNLTAPQKTDSLFGGLGEKSTEKPHFDGNFSSIVKESSKENLSKTFQQSIFGGNSNTASFSFSSFNTSETPGFGQSTEVNWKSGPKLFSSAPQSLAQNDGDKNTDKSVEGDEEEHDPHFQPIIDLPPLVAVMKDEESHDVLFKSRCKLYRFINDEWKERGVGEMKILQTKSEIDQAKSVKLLMRREQVRKICCNQLVTKKVPCFADMPNPKSTCWVNNDFSDGTASMEKFAVRFSSVDTLTDFTSIITKIQESLKAEDSVDTSH